MRTCYRPIVTRSKVSCGFRSFTRRCHKSQENVREEERRRKEGFVRPSWCSNYFIPSWFMSPFLPWQCLAWHASIPKEKKREFLITSNQKRVFCSLFLSFLEWVLFGYRFAWMCSFCLERAGRPGKTSQVKPAGWSFLFPPFSGWLGKRIESDFIQPKYRVQFSRFFFLQRKRQTRRF